MAETIDLRLVQMLCARLCHDLISPVGAINNGIELIDEIGPDMMEEAMGLIAQSSRQAAARLGCFRLAYGTAPDQGQVSWTDVREAARNYIGAGRAQLDWRPTALTQPAPGIARLTLCLVMLAEDALPYGGTIGVEASATGRPDLVVIAEGKSAVMRQEVAGALELATPVEDVSARLIHPFATALFARAQGLAVRWTQPDQRRLELRIAAP